MVVAHQEVGRDENFVLRALLESLSLHPGIQKRVRMQIERSQSGSDEKGSLAGHSFTDDLGIDSTAFLNFVMELEKQCDIDITLEDTERLKTVGDVIEYVSPDS
ncbi:MAG: acyl carrier protein [Patescibacteria group bacterium]